MWKQISRLISVTRELEENWKKIKKKFNLKDVEYSITLRIEKDKITLK